MESLQKDRKSTPEPVDLEQLERNTLQLAYNYLFLPEHDFGAVKLDEAAFGQCLERARALLAQIRVLPGGSSRISRKPPALRDWRIEDWSRGVTGS